jgi:hypothetical protein
LITLMSAKRSLPEIYLGAAGDFVAHPVQLVVQRRELPDERKRRVTV